MSVQELTSSNQSYSWDRPETHLATACTYSQFLVPDKTDPKKYDKVGFVVYNCNMARAVEVTTNFVNRSTPEEGMARIQLGVDFCKSNLADKRIQLIAQNRFVPAIDIALYGSRKDGLVGYLSLLEEEGVFKTLAEKTKAKDPKPPVLGHKFWNIVGQATGHLQTSIEVIKAVSALVITSCVANPAAAGYLVAKGLAGASPANLAASAALITANTAIVGASALLMQLGAGLTYNPREIHTAKMFGAAALAEIVGLPALLWYKGI